MVNSNPETVSTDYDTSDKLFFEPLTLEDVLNICHREKPDGVIVQFGGQTPLNLAAGLKAAGVPIIGTSVESIERAEDRKLFQVMLDKLGLNQPPNGTATNEEEAVAAAAKGRLSRARAPVVRARRPAPCRSSTATMSCGIICATPSPPRRSGPCSWIASSMTRRKSTSIASPTAKPP